MGTLEKINSDLVVAMKAHNETETSVLRMLKSSIKNSEIAAKKELSDVEVLAVLEKQAKQRKDSAEQFTSGGRQELADKELVELKIIESYLPQKITDEEVLKIVEKVILELGATSISDMGRVIKATMDVAAGTADGKQVSEIVREKLK